MEETIPVVNPVAAGAHQHLQHGLANLGGAAGIDFERAIAQRRYQFGQKGFGGGAVAAGWKGYPCHRRSRFVMSFGDQNSVQSSSSKVWRARLPWLAGTGDRWLRVGLGLWVGTGLLGLGV